RESRSGTRPGPWPNRPDNLHQRGSHSRISTRTILPHRRAVEAVHRRGAALDERDEDALRGRREEGPQRAFLLRGEALEDPVGGVDRERGPPDAEAPAREGLAPDPRAR